jgi:hypothetical protein
MKGKRVMKRLGLKISLLLSALAVLFLSPAGAVASQDSVEPSKKIERSISAPAPVSDLDKLEMEWEAVREQQIQMILEKERQLEKLKEEVFSGMKSQQGSIVSGSSSELEAQKAAFQAERQKFFAEMNRQKESLRQLQSTLDEKAKRLEPEKKPVAR